MAAHRSQRVKASPPSTGQEWRARQKLNKPLSYWPTDKQVRCLDSIVLDLGYQSGKLFAEEVHQVGKYGVIKWNKESVSALIAEAIKRRASAKVKRDSKKDLPGPQASPVATGARPAT